MASTRRGLGAFGQWPALCAKSVNGSGSCELSRAQTLDEVATPYSPGLLSGRQHPIDASEATRNPFCDNGTTGHDAIAIEQYLGRGIGADGDVGLDLW